MGFLLFIILLVVIYLASGIRIINQYERGVILTLGKYTGTLTPGLRVILSGFQTVDKVDMRITTVDIPQQEVITRDNVPAGINAVVYFQIISAEDSTLNIKDVSLAIAQYSQAALRDVIGQIELDELLTEREKTAESIQSIVATSTKDWGVKVTDIKIQDIELPADMKRVMARQAESERERRAIIIKSEGELEAAKKLSMAAEVLAQSKSGISLRTLQTIEKINPDPSKTVIFGLPVEFYEGFKKMSEK